MRNKKKQGTGKKVLWAFLFSFFIFLVIAISFFVKLVGVFQAGLFDGEHRFTVLLRSEKESDKVALVSFSPRENRVVMLFISGKKEEINSPGKLSWFLGVPIDGFIVYPFSLQGQSSDQKTSQFLTNIFKNVVLYYSLAKTNLTVLDAARIWLFVRNVPAHNISNATYQQFLNPQKMQDETLDTFVSSLFADNVVTNEKVSIHIINASGVSGFGNQFARIISNSGGNVVAVTTGDSILPTSEIAFANKETYTLKKLEKILQCKAIPVEKQTISDIVVILGKDKVSLFR